MTPNPENRRKLIGVLGLPVNRRGKILLTLRDAPHKPFWHNKWQLAGGEIEFGETPEQALAREMWEELGVTVRITNPYPIVKSVAYEKGKHLDFKEDVHLILLCFLVDIGNQKPTLDNDPEKETSNYRWFYPREVYALPSLPLTTDFVAEAEKLISKKQLRSLTETVIMNSKQKR